MKPINDCKDDDGDCGNCGGDCVGDNDENDSFSCLQAFCMLRCDLKLSL